MTTLDTLRERYTEVTDRIATAAHRAGRDPASVVLVAVSKSAGMEQVRELMSLGHRDFGESTVQQLIQRAAIVDEWRKRARTLPTAVGAAGAGSIGGGGAAVAGDQSVRWHMIGHLQRNKARKAIELCRLVHSVDTLRLAEEIQAATLRTDQTVDVLVQVNCSGEASKFGCAIPAAIHLCEAVETMVNLRLRGLMTMAAPGHTPDEARPCFARLRELFEEVAKAGYGGRHFNILSMGMSGDYEAAIAEGSNMVRVGSAIFGPPTEGPGGSADDGVAD